MSHHLSRALFRSSDRGGAFFSAGGSSNFHLANRSEPFPRHSLRYAICRYRRCGERSTKVSGTVQLDDKDVSKSSVDVTIDAAFGGHARWRLETKISAATISLT